MNIPGKFKVAGHEVVVKPFSHPYTIGHPMGVTLFDRNAIACIVDTDIPNSSLEQTFYHELVHYLLYAMGEDKLSSNEKFVEGFSQLLYQALTTMEGHISDNLKCDYSSLDTNASGDTRNDVQPSTGTISKRSYFNTYRT